MLLVKETVSLPQPTWTDWLKLNATTIYTIKIWRIECLFTFKWVHSVCIHFFFICSFFFTMSFAPCRQTLTNSFAPCQHVFTMSFAPCQNTTTCVLIFTWSFVLYIILIPKLFINFHKRVYNKEAQLETDLIENLIRWLTLFVLCVRRQ